jgi:Domain of unknown function (DUF4864)
MTRFLMICTMLAFAAPAAADELPTDQARKVIEHQLAAFARDDADEAFSYAAPGIQAAFPDPQEFLAMVAVHYPIVYRHRSVEFLDAAEENGQVAESVAFTDADGKVWQAIYRVEKEPDGQWVISGCVVAAASEQGL